MVQQCQDNFDSGTRLPGHRIRQVGLKPEPPLLPRGEPEQHRRGRDRFHAFPPLPGRCLHKSAYQRRNQDRVVGWLADIRHVHFHVNIGVVAKPGIKVNLSLVGLDLHMHMAAAGQLLDRGQSEPLHQPASHRKPADMAGPPHETQAAAGAQFF